MAAARLQLVFHATTVLFNPVRSSVSRVRLPPCAGPVGALIVMYSSSLGIAMVIMRAGGRASGFGIRSACGSRSESRLAKMGIGICRAEVRSPPTAVLVNC